MTNLFADCKEMQIWNMFIKMNCAYETAYNPFYADRNDVISGKAGHFQATRVRVSTWEDMFKTFAEEYFKKRTKTAKRYDIMHEADEYDLEPQKE